MAAEFNMETLALNIPVQSDFQVLREKSRNSFDVLSKRRILGSRDGLDLKNIASFICRSEVVSCLENMVFEHREILIRAPPASGKTSISQLLYLHLLKSHEDKLPVLLNCLKFDKRRPFEDQFALQSGLGMNMKDVASEGKDVIIIIDEAQLLYSSIETIIWDELKSGSADNLFFVFFAAYGEKVRNSETSTPYEFPKAAICGLKSLLLVRQEFEELVATLCPELNDFEVAQEQIFHSCEGHVGLVTTVLNELIDYSKEMVPKEGFSEIPLSEERVLKFLLSPRLADAIRSTRSFALDNSVPFETLNNIAMAFLDNPQVSYEPAHDKLIKSGIFVVKANELDSFITFSAPLIRRAFISFVLYNQLALGPLGQTFGTSVKDFMMACLASLRKENLLRSNALSVRGNLNEAKFKMEFFNIARQLLCGRARIDPEVGQVFKISDNASVDFYVNGSYQWAIEFLVESDRVSAHLDRFTEDGTYKPIPCNDYIVVDFVFRRSDSGQLRKSRYQNKSVYLRVIYDETFSKLTVAHLDTTTEINLH